MGCHARHEPPTAQRTAEGFHITLPLTIRLEPTDGHRPTPTPSARIQYMMFSAESASLVRTEKGVLGPPQKRMRRLGLVYGRYLGNLTRPST
jgi:hypothetical protein